MSPALLALTYGGLGCAGMLASRAEDAEIAAAGRGAWLTATLVLCAAWAVEGGSPQVLAGALGWAVGVAGYAFAGALALERGRLGWGMLGLGLLGAVAGGALRSGGGEATGGALAVLAGVGLGWAMRRGRHRGLRLLAYVFSFFVSFVVLIPRMVSLGAEPLSLPGRGGLLAGALLGALALGLAGGRALTRAGGTPEPLDPPTALCTTGIYAWIRHPIQIAEILAVLAGALAADTLPALIYAGGFALALKGPLRLLEEARLRERYGESYLEYQRRVPAWIPRVRMNLESRRCLPPPSPSP